MKKLYKKSELSFAIALIVLYCALQFAANPISEAVGIANSAQAVLNVAFSVILLCFLNKNKLFKYYGICKTEISLNKMLWFLPLAILATNNFWNGVAANLPAAETVCYMVSMLCVGLLEEVIFRGFLFKAMARDNVKSAVIVSSVTFGIGHLMNLINGSGMKLTANLCQVFSAIAIGFLFVTVFYYSKSLLPCIFTHSAINMISAFADETDLTDTKRIIFSIIIMIIAIVYTIFLKKNMEKDKANQE